MLDKSKLGERFVCYQCGTKFYDLNREVPNCPECNADQNEAPVRSMKKLLTESKTRLPETDPEPKEGEITVPGEDDAEEDEELSLALEDGEA